MGFTIGVLAASGGVGASTLTAALAVRAHTMVDWCKHSLAVDLDPRGGLDTTLCVEHLGGLRWADLERRDVSVTSWRDIELAELPGDDGMYVLASGGEPLPNWRLIAESLDVLTSQADLTAIDCGPRPGAQQLSRIDLLAVLGRTDAKGLADLRAVERECPLGRTQPVLVTRASGSSEDAAAAGRMTGLPLLGRLADDARVIRHARQGVPPGSMRSAVDSIADEVLAMADPSWLAAMMGVPSVPGGGA